MSAENSHSSSCTACLVMQACRALWSVDWTIADTVLHLSTHSSGLGRIQKPSTEGRAGGARLGEHGLVHLVLAGGRAEVAREDRVAARALVRGVRHVLKSVANAKLLRVYGCYRL